MKGNINMKNKLLITTAIASVAFAGVASAETKVGGNLEQTYVTASKTGNSSTNGLGAEHNISLSSSKDLDNGMSLSYSTELEDGTAHAHDLKIGINDMMNFAVGRDRGANLSSSVVPYIGDGNATSTNQLGVTTKDREANADYHNVDHARLELMAAGGTFTLGYAPDAAATNPGDSVIEEGENSIMGIVYSGSFGVDGLKVLAGQGKMDGEGNKKDAEETQIGVSYNAGQFTVGAETVDQENSAAAASQVKIESVSYGVSFAANDNMSIGVYQTETEKTTGTTKAAKDEEITQLQVGYNLGGLGISFGYAEVKNAGNATGADQEQFQIRTIQKF